MTWPITYAEVLAARERLKPYSSPTPLRHYPELDAALGHGIRVLVKHENHQPTQAFKVRNALAAMTALAPEARRRGVIAATRGNHGQGLAWAGARLGVAVTVCVPHGNSPAKNAAMCALGATLIEVGDDYDAAAAAADELVRERGMTLIHSTANRDVLRGAATITLEIIEQLEQPEQLDAMVVAVGGGSQAVGAMTVLRERSPDARVFAVQAAGASAIHDGYHRGEALSLDHAQTFADGLATRSCYPLTFAALCEGLADFVLVEDSAIAAALRLLLRTTHNLAEGAGATGLAGLLALRERLAGKTVAVILSGANIDEGTLMEVLAGEI